MDKKKKYFIYTSLVIFILSIITFYLLVGISIWLLPISILWAIFIFLIFIYRKLSLNKSIVLFSFIFLISGGLTYYANSLGSNNDCGLLYEKYNSKVYEFSGDKIRGQIGIKVDKDSCEYYATVQSIFESEKLVKNQVEGTLTLYNYLVDVVLGHDSGSSDGTLNPAFTNTDKLADDPFNISSPVLLYGYEGNETGYFYHTFQLKGKISESNIEDLRDISELRIYDSSKDSTIVDNGSGYKYLKIDHDAVLKNQSAIEEISVKID